MSPKCPKCSTPMDLVPLGMRDNKWSCPKCQRIFDNDRRTRRSA